MEKVKSVVLLLAAGSSVLAGAKNFIDRQRGDGRCVLIHLMAVCTGNTERITVMPASNKCPFFRIPCRTEHLAII